MCAGDRAAGCTGGGLPCGWQDQRMTSAPGLEPYDALLLVSFGGPEQAADVLPFLQNVTRGRGIPDARLEEVGQHYYDRGGRSPINDQNRALIAAVAADLAGRGIDLPIYWGNRNWDPYLTDALAVMQADGVRRAAAFVTSAYASYSGCRQYRENLFEAVSALDEPLVVDKLRHYFNHPGFVTAFADATAAAVAQLPELLQKGARLVFVTHSIPLAMADSSGPDGGAYVAQHLEAAAAVADELVRRSGVEHPWELVFCSRSGAPDVPWLEPDVNDRIAELAAEGTEAVVVVPIGFVSDHMEVVYDLDTEAAATAGQAGLAFARASTPGTHPSFVALVRDLLVERAAAERGERPERSIVGPGAPSWDVCAAGCCPNPRGPSPRCAKPRQESATADDRRSEHPAPIGPRDRARGRSAAPSRAARHGRGGRDQVQPDRHRDGGRPRVGAADPHPHPGGATRRRIRRRGGRRHRRARAASSGSPTRSTAPSTSCTASRSSPCRSRPPSTGRWWPAWCYNPMTGETFTAVLGGGAQLDGRADQHLRLRRRQRGAGGHRVQLPRRRPRRAGAGDVAAAPARPRRPADGVGGPRPLLRRLRPVRRVRRARASGRGTWPPAGWWRARPGRGSRESTAAHRGS